LSGLRGEKEEKGREEHRGSLSSVAAPPLGSLHQPASSEKKRIDP
jgi:hypothetical protein